MKRALLPILIYSVFSISVRADEPKRDILGVSTGITTAQAHYILHSAGWDCSDEKSNSYGCVKDKNTSIKFRVYPRDQDLIIVEIGYYFEKGDSAETWELLKKTYALEKLKDFAVSNTSHLYFGDMPSGEKLELNSDGYISIDDQKLLFQLVAMAHHSKDNVPPPKL